MPTKHKKIRGAFEKWEGQSSKDIIFRPVWKDHLDWALEIKGKVCKKVGIPLSTKDIDPPQENIIKSIMRLSRHQFQLFVDCPLTLSEWVEILKSKGELN